MREKTGPYLAARLGELAGHPLVGEVRTVGFIGAIELVKDKAKREFFPPADEVALKCRDHCFRLGIVMRAVRDTMVFAPPLTWTEAEIDAFAATARKALDLTLADIAKA